MKYDKKSIENRKRMERILRRIIDILLTIVIYNMVLVSITAMNRIDQISILDYKAYVITTDSMEPNLKSGDVVVEKEEKEENLKVNDIITYQKGESKITHRITRIVKKENQNVYMTKGDNNKIEDTDGITYDKILGKEVIRIPFIGKIINLLNNQIVFLIFIFMLLLLYFWRIVIEEKKENRREKKIEEIHKKQY